MTSKERVLRTLEFALPRGERVPRQMWALPWSEIHYPGLVDTLRTRFPEDVVMAPSLLKKPLSAIWKGDPHKVGRFIDEWGCVFDNLEDGIIGEIKKPLVEDWSDVSRVHFPVELWDVDVDAVNAFCRSTDRFVYSGAVPRPFERMQFIRGTENVLMDLAEEDADMLAFLRQVHEGYLRELEAWSRTEVDGLFFMDDWGSQKNLLIRPETWRTYFKPLYKDYIDLAHAAGKKIFMHSDGVIVDIYPDLIELGLDALNSQLFCMDLERVAPFKGQITFWGEMDRQQILPNGSRDEVFRAVREIYAHCYADGGVIAQCEFGPGAKPENVQAVFEAWDTMTKGA